MEGKTEQYGLNWLTWRIATPLITEESVNCLAAQKTQHTNISRGNALTMPWNIRMADFKTGRSYVNLSRNALAQQTEPYSQLSRSKVKIQNYGAALSWAAPNIRSHFASMLSRVPEHKHFWLYALSDSVHSDLRREKSK